MENIGASAVKLFYMNQGSRGEYGTPPYQDYDVVLIAENPAVKPRFHEVWKGGVPTMSIQAKDSDGRLRVITDVFDLDLTLQQVRPMVTFQLAREGIRIVFVHLKSGNERVATLALRAAATRLTSEPRFKYQQKQPTLWIGDFNRADDKYLVEELNAKCIFAGGGFSDWKLDRIYISGDWKNFDVEVTEATRAAGDHNHIGMVAAITRKSS